MNLLDIFEGREPHQQAIDRLEQARIDHLKEKLDYYAEHKMAKEFRAAKEELESYFKVKEPQPSGVYKKNEFDITEPQDECMGYGSVVGEAGIGQDIANKTEKMARATPSTPAGKVASTVKNAAKWLAGKGGPGKEGPTYEGAGDIEDQGEYDQEGAMVKDNLHTIRREAQRLEKILSDNENVPEWVQDKLAQVKGMISSASEYMQTQRERDHEEMSGEEGLTMAEAQKKNSEEVDEAGGGWALDPKTKLELKKRRERQKTIAKWAGKPVPPQEPKEKEINEDQQLHVGDPIIVTAPNEFEGKTGEIAEFSPSGKFIIVNLYNHGKQPMHLSDVEYNQYADEEDEVDEGFQDFNKVEPYAVCLAGKPVKKFDYYEEARRFHDNWKQKLYREGNKEKADKITLMPLNLDEELAGEPRSSNAISKQKTTINRPASTSSDQVKTFVSQGYIVKFKPDVAEIYHGANLVYSKPGNYSNPTKAQLGIMRSRVTDLVSKKKVDEATPRHFGPKGAGTELARQIRAELANMQQGKGTPVPAKEFARGIEKDLQKAMARPKIQVKKNKGVTEAETDYSKRRQRERDIDAGKPVAKQRPSKMTDYQKRRAQQKKEMELGEMDKSQKGAAGWNIDDYDYSKGKWSRGKIMTAKDAVKSATKDLDAAFNQADKKKPKPVKEDQDTSGVESAIIRRIMVAHTDLLKQFGPQKVMQAAEEVAYNVGDVDEIGSSDVSAYVNQVKQILGVTNEEQVNEKWSEKYKRSINCANPKGFSQKAHCAGRKK